MRITDGTRGDDHISNTPKHVLLFEALGAPVPRFPHVPLILVSPSWRTAARIFAVLADVLRRVEPFDEHHVESALRETAAALIHAARVAVTGRAASPGLFEVLVLLGRATTLGRLERLLAWLAAGSGQP